MKDVQGSSHGQVWCATTTIAWKHWKTIKMSIMMASLFVKIWTLHLLNTKQECCPLDYNIQYSKIQKDRYENCRRLETILVSKFYQKWTTNITINYLAISILGFPMICFYINFQIFLRINKCYTVFKIMLRNVRAILICGNMRRKSKALLGKGV